MRMYMYMVAQILWRYVLMVFLSSLLFFLSLFFQFYVNLVFSFCFARHRTQTIVNCQHASGKRDLISCKRDLRQCTIFLPRYNFLHLWHTILSTVLCTIFLIEWINLFIMWLSTAIACVDHYLHLHLCLWSGQVTEE